MGEQGRLSRAVYCCQRVPEFRLVPRQPFLPTLMPRVDGSSGYTFLQTGSLGGKGWRVKSDLQAASGGREAVKGRQHEVVQRGLEGDRRVFCQGVAQRQRTVCRQLGDESVGQRPCRILVIVLGISGTPRNRDGRPLQARTTGLLALARRYIDTLPNSATTFLLPLPPTKFRAKIPTAKSP